MCLHEQLPEKTKGPAVDEVHPESVRYGKIKDIQVSGFSAMFPYRIKQKGYESQCYRNPIKLLD